MDEGTVDVLDEQFELDAPAAPDASDDTPADLGDKQDNPSEDPLDADPLDDSSADSDSSDDEDPSVKEEPSEKSPFDEDLDDWAEKTGHDKPENDRERKLLQTIRDGQRSFTKEKMAEKAVKSLDSAVSEVKKEVPQDPSQDDTADAKIARIEARYEQERAIRLQSEYIRVNEISDETVAAMGDVLKEEVALAETPEEKQKVIDYLTDPKRLSQWVKLGKARVDEASQEASKELAVQKERGRIEKEQKASGVRRNAKNTVSTEKKDPIMELWKD